MNGGMVGGIIDVTTNYDHFYQPGEGEIIRWIQVITTNTPGEQTLDHTVSYLDHDNPATPFYEFGGYDQRGVLDFSSRRNISDPITWHAELHLVKAFGNEVWIFPEGIEWGWSISDRCHCLPEPNLSVTSSVNPSKVFQPTFLTATFSNTGDLDPTGYVMFVNNDGTGQRYIARVPIEKDVNGVLFARTSTSFVGAGTQTVTATFDGDESWLGIRASFEQTVEKQNCQLNMGSSANPVVFGQPVTFTAIVSAVEPGIPTPTGTVNFYDGSAFLGSGTLDANGQATLTTSELSAGDHAITAVYDGDEYFNGTASDVLTQTIEPSGSNSSISGRIWWDADGDGIRDGDESGFHLPLDVSLLDADGNLVATTSISGPDGTYEFTDLAPGTYQVAFFLPSGYTATLRDQGGDDTLDSDFQASEIFYWAVGSDLFDLAADQTIAHLDAGVVWY